MLAEPCVQSTPPPRARKRPKRYDDGDEEPLLEVLRRKKSKSLSAPRSSSSAASSLPQDEEKNMIMEIQTSRCSSTKYEGSEYRDIPRCISCIRRQAGDTCRFMGIRCLVRNAQTSDPERRMCTFNFEHSGEGPRFEYPTSWNVKSHETYLQRTKVAIANSLLPVLQLALEHQTIPDGIRRPPEIEVRATCDTCMTSIFSSSWMCVRCGQECCSDCYDEVRRLTNPAWRAIGKNSETNSQKLSISSKPGFLNCSRGSKHQGKHFSAVSRFRLDELEKAIDEMEKLVKPPKATEESQVVVPRPPLPPLIMPPPASLEHHAPTSQTTYFEDAEGSPPSPLSSLPDDNMDGDLPPLPQPQPQPQEHTEPATADLAADDIPSHITQVFSDSELTEDTFREVWKQGYPLVVTDQLSKFAIGWTPEYFIEKYGQQECTIVECQTNENKQTTVGEFFKQFKTREGRKGCWKLKDWPPSMDFKTAFPELFDDFARAVPMPNYTRRDGILNIASHFPSNTVAPDIGPKMYNAMETFETAGSNGTTRLHMDMADAVNVMLHAEPRADGSPGVAAWDLFRPEDSDAIRKFMREKFSEVQTNDPIHIQRYYLDSTLRRELYEKCGIKSHRIYQRPGEAVFIPAGCAHQVCNLADCVKVAVDFVSPENITRCEKLTQEFRDENLVVSWKEDVLQLRTMMWHAWQSCSRQQEALVAAAQ
ncbi:Clavaminate synthase-like protein [Dentipellis sp. KUC8613]|nr:Clavaminate synthase-like protein [Dentipellis sp. KUC8613]